MHLAHPMLIHQNLLVAYGLFLLATYLHCLSNSSSLDLGSIALHYVYILIVNSSSLSHLSTIMSPCQSYTLMQVGYLLYAKFPMLSIATLNFFLRKSYTPIFRHANTRLITQSISRPLTMCLTTWDNQLHKITHNINVINTLAIVWIAWASICTIGYSNP